MAARQHRPEVVPLLPALPTSASQPRPEEISLLPALSTRSKAGKRRRCPVEQEMSPPSSAPPTARRRASPGRPATRSQSSPLSDQEKEAITVAAARGIEGTSAISIHEMVSRRFMIPDFVKSIGPNAMTYYFDERRRMMTGHNDAIRSEVINDTEQLREEFRGRGVVPCPECRQDVAWGNIMSHRLETCKEKRV